MRKLTDIFASPTLRAAMYCTTAAIIAVRGCDTVEKVSDDLVEASANIEVASGKVESAAEEIDSAAGKVKNAVTIGSKIKALSNIFPDKSDKKTNKPNTASPIASTSINAPRPEGP